MKSEGGRKKESGRGEQVSAEEKARESTKTAVAGLAVDISSSDIKIEVTEKKSSGLQNSHRSRLNEIQKQK